MRSHRFRAMGTDVHLLLPYGGSAAVALVRKLFRRWESTLSRFIPGSELSRLNDRAGEPVAVTPLLFEVASASVEAAHATEGAFDPTLLPQLVRIGYSSSFEVMPRAVAPARGLAIRGGSWRSIALDPRSRTITLPLGCALDFGGIAKGMAVDAALETLGRHGITSALVGAGGDLSVRGLPVGSRSWPVLVGDDDARRVVPLIRGALATSGVSRRTWLQGTTRRHHLVDPDTGEPAENDLWEVTVAAETCKAAEVAATATFVLGSRLGGELLARHRLAALLTLRDGTLRAVGAWPSLVADAA